MAITENFTGTNGTNPPNANWTTFREGGIQIFGNQARGTTASAYNGAYYSGVSWNSNHSSEAKFGMIDAGSTEQSGPVVRVQPGSGHFYWLMVREPTSQAIIYYFNGSFNVLQTINGITVADDDVWKLEATGTTLKAYKNGAQIGTDQTDSNLSGGYPGIIILGELLLNIYADDWVGTGEAATSTIGITTPAQLQARQVNASDQADIPITGTTTNVSDGEPVEGSFNGGAYASLGTVSGGTFSGTLSNQAGGQGTLTVRLTNDTGVTATVTLITLTDVFVFGGDSRADGRLTNNQTYSGVGSVPVYRHDDAWTTGEPYDTDATGGSFGPLIANLYSALHSRPPAFITVGTGSTDLYGSGTNQWTKGNSSYTELAAQIASAATAGVKAGLFLFGPNAIVNATTPAQADYNAAVDQFASDFASDFNTTASPSPKVFIDLCGEAGTGSPPDRRLAEDNVRQAILQAVDDNSQVALLCVLIDQDYTDDVHPLSDAQALVVARRSWVGVENELFSGIYGRGPRVSGSITIDADLDTITINYDRDLASGTTYGGFRVEDSGTPATITSATRTGTRQVVIVLSAPASAAANVTVSFGSNDDAKGQTVPTSTAITLPDTNTITLPAEPFVDVVVVAGGGGELVGTADLVLSASGTLTGTRTIIEAAEAGELFAAVSALSALLTATAEASDVQAVRTELLAILQDEAATGDVWAGRLAVLVELEAGVAASSAFTVPSGGATASISTGALANDDETARADKIAALSEGISSQLTTSGTANKSASFTDGSQNQSSFLSDRLARINFQAGITQDDFYSSLAELKAALTAATSQGATWSRRSDMLAAWSAGASLGGSFTDFGLPTPRPTIVDIGVEFYTEIVDEGFDFPAG